MISIKGLTVAFGAKTVLDNINLTFENGIYCIFAPSGRGKTTLLNAMAGLIAYYGEIKATGKICYVFQDNRLLPWLNAEKNIYISASGKEQAEHYISAFGIDEFRTQMPKTLSGGMQRRVALARGLAFGGDIFLLDEPFRGLDKDNKAAVIGEIKRLNGTVIIVTHEEADAGMLNAKTVYL